MKKYLLIYCDDNGKSSEFFNEEDLQEFLSDNSESDEPLTFLNELPRFDEDLYGHMVLFEAKLIVPEKVEVVTKYKL